MIALLLSALVALADAPEISTSRGDPIGVVVLWPRVIPATTDPSLTALAGQVQLHLQGIVMQTFPGRPIDARPEPQRVCPQGGCLALNLGALLVHDGRSCAVVGIVSPAGPSPQTLIPWLGQVRFREPFVPFRQPPESWVQIADYQLCEDVPRLLAEGSAALRTTLAGVTLPTR